MIYEPHKATDYLLVVVILIVRSYVIMFEISSTANFKEYPGGCLKIIGLLFALKGDLHKTLGVC